MWCSGRVVGRINEVVLHRIRLVLGWVTIFGRAVHLCIQPALYPFGVAEIEYQLWLG